MVKLLEQRFHAIFISIIGVCSLDKAVKVVRWTDERSFLKGSAN